MGCNHYNIEEFLKKFWAGETSLEEEKSIREYFAFNELPENLKDDSAYFQFIKNQADVELDDDFDLEVISQLDNDSSYGSAKVFSMNNRWFGMVASIVIVLGIFWWALDKSGENNFHEDQATIENLKVIEANSPAVRTAFDQTKSALFMISTKLNKGTEPAKKITKINKAQDLIHSLDSNGKEEVKK